MFFICGKRKTEMKDDKKTILFEETPVPKTVMTLAVPTVVGCLVMILYNLADTYFVGMLNNPVETAAVTLGATVILAFNAVTNLFGVGASNNSFACGFDTLQLKFLLK